MANYTASKSKTQGREAWSVIFRHPARIDVSTGRPGKRVRKGLGTSDTAEADRLVAQLNELLANELFWEPSSRPLADDKFDLRVVDIFYDGMTRSAQDPLSIRDQVRPLPSAEDGYTSVMFLGTTGAGKTTAVRQLLGTDPTRERFPSTSTAKTTVADTEVVLTDSPEYSAVVTFVSRDEVVEYLTENVSEATLAAYEGRQEAEILRRLLDHVNQRFRFSYILGRGVSAMESSEDLDDDELEDEFSVLDLELGDDIDIEGTREVLQSCVADLQTLVRAHVENVRATLGVEQEDDKLAFDELVEESLDLELRHTEEFHAIVDRLLDEIEKRLELLNDGDVQWTRQGWPISWTFSSVDREGFLRALLRFSSNYAPLFGRLLTPLVNGMRVFGPFAPKWADDAPRLILIDGEGLGHTPTSTASVSNTVAKRVEQVDAVVLVDNATQPMQAAPISAMKMLASSGNGGKVFFLFTHFDLVKGPNIPRFDDREAYVLASVENVLRSMGEQLGALGERILRRRLDDALYFVGGIHEPLREEKKAGSRTVLQLRRLLSDLVALREEIDFGPKRPVYDRMNLSLAVAEAAKSFHAKWLGLLGLEHNPHAPKEHWARIKALSRRLAEGWEDQYGQLTPLADLRTELQIQLYLMLQRPVRWDGGDPSDDERQAITDELSNAMAQQLFGLVERRLRDDVRTAWQEAYLPLGPGSTRVRARIISNDVYARSVPIPTVAASPEQNQFLHDVADIVSNVAAEYELTFN